MKTFVKARSITTTRPRLCCVLVWLMVPWVVLVVLQLFKADEIIGALSQAYRQAAGPLFFGLVGLEILVLAYMLRVSMMPGLAICARYGAGLLPVLWALFAYWFTPIGVGVVGVNELSAPWLSVGVVMYMVVVAAIGLSILRTSTEQEPLKTPL